MKVALHKIWVGCLTAFLAVASGQGPQPEQVLLDRLQSPDPATRRAAAESIARLEPKNLGKLLAGLLKALRDTDPEVKYYAAVSLAGSGQGDETNATMLKEAAPVLLESLEDRDARVREAAVSAIAVIMPQPPPEAISPLLRLLTNKDPEPRVRQAAVTTLARIRPVRSNVVAALVTVLRQDESPAIRRDTAAVLGELRVSDQGAVEALAQALTDRNTQIGRAHV